MSRDYTLVIATCLVALGLGAVGFSLYRDSLPTEKNWSSCMLDEMVNQPADMYPIAEIQCQRYRDDDLLEKMVQR